MSQPIGTKTYRVTKAIHWWFTTDKTQSEIADELGVSERKVREYIKEPPADEVKEALEHQETQVRLTAFEELRRQLRAAGERSRSAEKPVKVWQDDQGRLQVRDVRNDTGEVVERAPVNADVELLADEKARYYAREEIREILDRLVDLVGAAEPDQLEVEGSGIVIHTEADDEIS